MKLETHNYKEARYPRNVALAHSAPRQQFQGKLTDMCHRCSNCGRGFSSRKRFDDRPDWNPLHLHM